MRFRETIALGEKDIAAGPSNEKPPLSLSKGCPPCPYLRISASGWGVTPCSRFNAHARRCVLGAPRRATPWPWLPSPSDCGPPCGLWPPLGQTAFSLAPLAFLDRLAALVPLPRRYRHRYRGVLAPHAPLRAAVTIVFITEAVPFSVSSR